MHPGGAAGARADNLLTRLTHTCPDPHARRDDTGDGDAGDGAGDGAGGGGGGPLGGGLGPVQRLLRAELDTLLGHAVPWHPTHPDQPPGHTDHDNLGPLCDTTNRAKEAAGWRASPAPRRPPPLDPPPHRPDHHHHPHHLATTPRPRHPHRHRPTLTTPHGVPDTTAGPPPP
jgi:hypothetical protein